MYRTLRLCRIALDMNLKELAVKMQKSRAYLCDVENARRNPSVQTLKQYAEVYGIPL